jgi:AraC-like DNA-binding protein
VGYAEFPPRGQLSDLVVCTWERELAPNGASPAARILPDGCVDLVWRAGQLLVAGPDTEPFMSAPRRGETIVGLRLRPGIAGRVLGLPVGELRDARVQLRDVWGARGAELEERIAAAGAPRRRRSRLEDALVERMSETSEPDWLVVAATRRLGLPGSRVGSLSEALATSERQLLRRFKDAVGYGPKTLDRVLRFQRFVSRAPTLAGGEERLARVAVELGYADQAHLNRECTRLSGLSPARLVASRIADDTNREGSGHEWSAL